MQVAEVPMVVDSWYIPYSRIYLAGIIFGGIVRKIAIGRYKFGGYSTIATPDVGAILADF